MIVSKYFLLVVSTILVVALLKQSEAALIGEQLGQRLIDGNKKFNAKAAIGGDGNIVIQLAEEAIKDLEISAALHPRNGNIGEAIKILKEGWELTIKMIADALDEGFDLIDRTLGNKIINKDAALSSIIKGMNEVRSSIYHSGSPLLSALGAARVMANFAYKEGLSYAIEKTQDCGTAIVDDLEVAQYFAIQGLNADEDEVLQKCLKAAHSAIMTAAIASNTALVDGGKSAFEYLASSDEASIIKHDPIEGLIFAKAKEAAAADSDTVEAVAELEAEFTAATKMGISAPVLKEVKDGLLKYIQNCAWSVAISNEAIAKAKILAKTDSQGAIRIIEDAMKAARLIIIDGSVKAYDGLGAAGKLSGLMQGFQAAIEIVEKSRVEGTGGLENIKKLATSAAKVGGVALDQALDSAHITLEALEAIIFDLLHECRDLAFKVLKPGFVHIRH